MLPPLRSWHGRPEEITKRFDVESVGGRDAIESEMIPVAAASNRGSVCMQTASVLFRLAKRRDDALVRVHRPVLTTNSVHRMLVAALFNSGAELEPEQFCVETLLCRA